MIVADIMSAGTTTVTPDATIRAACELMLQLGISGLPVVNAAGDLVGMVTEADMLHFFELQRAQRPPAGNAQPEPQPGRRELTVRDAMSHPAIFIDDKAPVGQLAALLNQHHIKRVPVVSNGRMIGIVSRADVLRAVVASLPV